MSQMIDRLRLVGLATLLAMAGFNVLSGFILFFGDAGGGDLNLRWTEQQYILRHKNPFDVYAAWLEAREQDPQLQPADFPGIDPDLGLPTPGYPPWSYGTAISFLWPADPMIARVCLAFVNVLALGCVVFWHVRRAADSLALALAFIAVSLSADSLGATLVLGQLGVLVVGSLLAAIWLDERDRPVLAGILLGVALIKPTLSLPFLLAFLIQRRWLTLAVAGAYTVGACAIVWGLVDTDPITMFRQMQEAVVKWGTVHYSVDYDPIAVLKHIGVPAEHALRVSTALNLAITGLCMWFWRHASMMTLGAIAAFTARVWVAHFHYDDVILLFLLFGLAQAVLTRASIHLACAYGILAFSLFLPRLFHTGLAWDHLSRRIGFEGELVVLLCQLGCLGVLLYWAPVKRPEIANAIK